MKIVAYTLIIVCLFMVAGCGGSEEKQEAQQPQEKEVKAPAAKPAAQPAPKAEDKAPKKDEKKAEAPAAQKDEWILVFEANDKVEEKEREKVLNYVKKKWFTDREYGDLVDLMTYNQSMEKYIGKKVLIAEVRSEYGRYEFSLRMGKIVDNDGPEEQEIKGGSDKHIRERDSFKALMKDILFECGKVKLP